MSKSSCNPNPRRLRFTPEDDLILLRETVAQNSFDDIRKWNLIQENVVRTTCKNFTLRAVKGHIDHMLNLFTKEDRTNLKKSGTEEQYTEKEIILQELRCMREEFGCKRRKTENKTAEYLVNGMNSLTDYLNKKLSEDVKIKEAELQLEEKKLEMEKKRLELQEKKLDIDKREQESRLKMMEQQQQIINIFLDKMKP